MNDSTQKYEVLRTLNIIAEKTKSAPLTFNGKQLFYLILEIFCYSVFVLLLVIAFILPSGPSLVMQADSMQMNLGIRTEGIDLILMCFRIALLLMSLFPLGISLLLMRSRRKSRKLYEVHQLVNGAIKGVVGK